MKDKWTMLGIFANAHNEANLPVHIVGEMARDFQIGDLDGDGQQDVLSYYDEWIGVNYVKNKNFGEMVTIYRTEAKTDVYEVVIYDVDKDGDNDIIAALNPDVALGTKPSLIWLENQNNSFTKVNTILSNQRDIEDIAYGDFDKDGDIDLVLTRNISAGIYLKNNGNGSFANNPFYATGRETMVIDFNKDGFDDVLSWRGNGDIIYYSENDKAGGFKTRKNLAAFDLIHDVEVFDFDFDGDYDLLANGSENFQSQLVVLYNDNFTFTNSKLITNNYTGTCLELSFENGLSKPTVITGGYLDLYKYQGNGNFDFVAGATPYYTYNIFRPLAIDGASHLMATGGENNGYLMDVAGILVSRLTSSFDLTERELTAFPNPAKDRITIVCESFSGATVIDASGNKLLESKDAEISLNGLPGGIYFILVHQVGVLKVIKD
ncbi:MAG: T9SS type A sorting domain-containing protein [Saprospiraceae bacterium]|nr:T9SS type A sorting domain-containing protein [Saprospiraceae bacterium]